MCDTNSRLPACCTQLTGSACAAPTPRETNNYYSRNHIKDSNDDCKGSCYCPEGCCCPHKGMNGRYASPTSCDPCAIMDCCCTSSCGGGCCCRSCKPSCCSPSPKCCTPPKCCSPPRCCSPPSPSCCPEPCCDPCCGPYTPPCRKPICYPPVDPCDDTCPSERICYYPCPQPCQPKYCTCGSPNPCDCDLNAKKRQAISEMAPCCRRCGRKVYAAEKIMASGGAFHSSCFSCYCCHKPLEVTNMYENQGEIYCKQCYAKYFGVQGYGYGSTLLSSI
ncbi:PREDICTED: keratin-associated protein 4-9-like [Nicrophorus vespilloides]|uniref:Keratin-associated protein 4-9-like n=1 Tax=Nicrophorus vespilloides TaxID=110193 RepID=A0ABM1ML58_NICVS|nr:PREDICTED: keratin-associated protein 4-9-like [Nicrophorus vespilloides]